MLMRLPKLFTTNNAWMEQTQTSILSAAMVITITSVISALSGLLVRRVLIGLFFDTPASQQALEAFWVAFQIPDTMFQLLILGALSAAFIPIFSKQKQKDPQIAFTMSSIMMNTLLLAFLVVGVVVFIFAGYITELRTGQKFSPEQVVIVTNLTRIMICAQFFFAISNFMTGILQSYRRFIIPAIAPIVYNLGTIAGVYLFQSSLGIYSAGIGIVLGAFVHMMIQFPLVYKLGFRYKLSFDFKYPGIGEFFKLMPPRVVAIGANEIRKLLLGFFATSLGNLSFTMMQLALALMAIPIRFFGVSISQASLPFLSEESNERDFDHFRRLVLQSLHQIAFLTFPASVLLLILRVPIVRITFGTENFPWSSTIITGKILAIISISITAQAMVQLLIRAFYALKDTRTPLYIALADVFVYFALCYTGITYFNWGVLAIATATTATALIEFLLFLIILDRKIKGFSGKDFWLPQLKMIMASFLMAIFLYLPFRILDELVFNTTKTIELVILTITTGTIGMVVYLYFAALFEIKELSILTQFFDSYGGKWAKALAMSDEVIIETSVDAEEV
jgi:putative peptidoglycan lipid II flippase